MSCMRLRVAADSFFDAFLLGSSSQEIMPLGPASGICCGYTMTRAILSDAIALVRGLCSKIGVRVCGVLIRLHLF